MRKFRATFVDCGEGACGDYDPEDTEDEALLRIDLQVNEDGEWRDLRDGSYCTQVPVDTTEPERARLLAVAVAFMEDADRRGHSIKRAAEHVSWLDPSWVEARMGEDNLSREVRVKESAS